MTRFSCASHRMCQAAPSLRQCGNYVRRCQRDVPVVSGGTASVKKLVYKPHKNVRESETVFLKTRTNVRITYGKMDGTITTFIYEHEDLKNQQLELPVVIPHNGSLAELASIFLTNNDVPVYLEKEFVRQLQEFVAASSQQRCDQTCQKQVDDARSDKVDIEDVIRRWEKRYKEECYEYSERKCVSDEELFAMAYHKLVHSPVLGTMLQLEHTYAQAIRERTRARDRQRRSLERRQTDEMNTAVDNLNISMDEKSINQLVAKHFEDLSMLQGEWSSELDTMKEVQRRDYREWIMQMLEENQANSSLPTPSSAGSPVCESECRGNQLYGPESYAADEFEESFTIHLGSQLKQMHNIRILSTDVMELCSTWERAEPAVQPAPHVLQTALALYSNDLCGLVLMTDSHVDSYSNSLKDFARICQSSTEFHFPHFEDQLDRVRDSIRQHRAVGPAAPRKSFSSGKTLQTGDVFITRHSNLAQVHVIFHMVSDDSTLSRDMNSRHPVLLGLRNILKTACSHDITSLTIPLLLQYEMTEEMTVQWCTKRAELVFKCVKGFMIEMASWGGSELKNLQFLLPRGISAAVFQSLTAMLPNIFKLSNPLVLKSNHVKDS